jgi:hypothetical protein
MKRVGIIALAALSAALWPVLAVRAQGTVMSMSAVGAGANGYDFMVGDWSCINTMAPSKLGALQSAKSSITKLNEGSLAIHTMSPNGDVTAYNAYVPKTKTWWAPFADAGGNYGYESTQQSGKTIRWVGAFYTTDGATTPIRDTFTMLSMTKQYDLSEARVAGMWKTVAKTTCTKS